MLRRAALALLTISVMAWAAPVASADTAAPRRSAVAAIDSAARSDTSSSAFTRAVSDSLRDSAKAGRKAAVKDTTVKRTIPARLLSFDDQLLFALVFMSYIAVMLTSMTNVNP